MKKDKVTEERRCLMTRCHVMPRHIMSHYVRKKGRHMTSAVSLIHHAFD